MVNRRQRLHLEGIVQGVGFRPHVFRLAQQLNLSGFVGNDSRGVFIEIEGPEQRLHIFRELLVKRAPAASFISALRVSECRPRGEGEFSILASRRQSRAQALVSPDLDCCRRCLDEVLNPSDRRFRYPFTNCTNCGPRYTLIRQIPYDREHTTMAEFAMCPACLKEYEDPGDRRFHAQPNACPQCGPRLSTGLDEVVASLLAGEVIALKGVGGYHLVCDAFNPLPIQRLRQRKGRFAKPFAVMVKDLEQARRLAYIAAGEAELLNSRAKPIVLLRGRGVLPPEVAPEVEALGLMLPHSPLHHLLFSESSSQDRPDKLRALVMTSANLSGEPIVYTREASRRLEPLADKLVHHDRPIETPCDDSVVRLLRGVAMPLRRSRGFAPFPVQLAFDLPPLLALGAQLKSTFCLGRARQAFLSQHLGDLDNLETWNHFERALHHLRKLYRIEPRGLCLDMHPGYLSRHWAERQGLPLLQVQHHHAHIASLMAEQQLGSDARVLGLAFDGTGYGSDATVWGGEVLRCGYGEYERVAWLKPVPLLGGEAAVRQPWRMALAHLWAAGLPWHPRLAPVAQAGPETLPILQRQLERGLNAPLTSSLGRLFDAVAALLGLHQVVEYEAQAAMALESIADRSEPKSYHFGQPFDAGPVFSSIVDDLCAGDSIARISMRFHRAVAGAAVRLCRQHSEGLAIALSGGVFQNMVLSELVIEGLQACGFKVLWHRQVPPNDGGLALGQLAVAAHQRGELCV